MLTNLAKLHHHGYEVDWESVNQASAKDVRLPTYAWQREKFWLESKEGEYLRCAPLEHPLLGLEQVAPMPTWRFELDPRYFTWLDDHRFWDSVIFPAPDTARSVSRLPASFSLTSTTSSRIWK